MQPEIERLYRFYSDDSDFGNLVAGCLYTEHGEAVGRHTWKMHSRLGGITFFAFGSSFRLTVQEDRAVCSVWVDIVDHVKRQHVTRQENWYMIFDDAWRISDLDDFLRAVWTPPTQLGPARVPWEITMIADATARDAALNAYWAALP